MTVEFCVALSIVVAMIVGITVHNNIKLSNVEKDINSIRKLIIDCEQVIRNKLDYIVDEIEEGEYDVDLELEDGCECECEACDLCAEVSDDELDIHLITRERYTFDDRNDYLKYELKYYPNSDRLEYQTVKYNKDTDEFDDEVMAIEYVAEVIGDGLRFFGVCSGDPNVAYVRNNKFKCDFKIERVVG